VNRVPTRTCLGCRERRPKQGLVRLVRRADGVVTVGATLPGRGAYVCAQAGCVEQVLKAGRLAHAFRGACRIEAGLRFNVLASGRTAAVAGHDTGA